MSIIPHLLGKHLVLKIVWREIEQLMLKKIFSYFSLMHHDTRPSPLVRCSLGHGKIDDVESSKEPDHRSDARSRIDPKVLIIVETTYSRLGRDIAELLVYNRIK